jgi:carboxypeptidase Taq
MSDTTISDTGTKDTTASENVTSTSKSRERDRALSLFYQELDQTSLLRDIASVLAWDQQVMMPVAATEGRAKQRAYLASLLHQRQTSPTFLDLVDTLAKGFDELSEVDKVNVREAKKDVDRMRTLPTSFVEEKSSCASACYATWIRARPANDFTMVESGLQHMFELNRREAEYVGYQTESYDALLDVFEPGARLNHVLPTIRDLCSGLRGLLANVQQTQGPRPEAIAAPVAEQVELNAAVAEALGFSFSSGRIDPTAHPFACSMGANDVRITTRFNKNDFLSSLYSVLHETGHALYESGLPGSSRGYATGSSVSLSIHESQSLLWEDIVGRSSGFCEFLHPLSLQKLGQSYPTPDALWRRLNFVEPGLIRVEADEITYPFHILIRLELEVAAIRGELSVRDMPSAWNELYRTHLGLDVPNDTDGILQDVHWFRGAVGYFPTYALGRLLAAMLYEAALRDTPNLEQPFAQGSFSNLTKWLNSHVYRFGKQYSGADLITNATGLTPSSDAFLSYATAKFGA